MKVIIKKVLISISGVILAILAAEVTTAKLNPQETLDFVKEMSPACFAQSDILPFELKKGTVCYFLQQEFKHAAVINSSGYRGQELSFQKSKDIFRILTVGDSFTFGQGVKDNNTYSTKLEEIFKNNHKNVEVINGGYASSFSPDSYFLFLKGKGLDLKADLVIMGFFIWNDITDLAETQWEMMDENGLPTKINSRLRMVDKEGHLTFVKPKRRYSIPILANSHFFQLVYSYKQSAFDKLFALFDKNPNFDPEKEAMAIYNACIFEDDCFLKYQKEWEKIMKVIKATKELLAENDISFLIVLIPTKEQLNDPDLGSGINKKLGQFFEENNIDYLDLYDQFKGRQINEFYFSQDAHWTNMGHQLAAEIIFDYLWQNLNF